MNNNFDIFVNGAPKTITFTRSQVSGETVWVYFETRGVPDINILKIKNTILLSTFPKQVNLVYRLQRQPENNELPKRKRSE